MKTIFFSLLMATLMPTLSFAKVENFNAMIIENSKAQNRLQKDLNEQLEVTKQAQRKHARKEFIEVTSDYEDYNSPTANQFLTFQKESVHYRPSEEKQMQRIANEIKAADPSF